MGPLTEEQMATLTEAAAILTVGASEATRLQLLGCLVDIAEAGGSTSADRRAWVGALKSLSEIAASIARREGARIIQDDAESA